MYCLALTEKEQSKLVKNIVTYLVSSLSNYSDDGFFNPWAVGRAFCHWWFMTAETITDSKVLILWVSIAILIQVIPAGVTLSKIAIDAKRVKTVCWYVTFDLMAQTRDIWSHTQIRHVHDPHYFPLLSVRLCWSDNIQQVYPSFVSLKM